MNELERAHAQPQKVLHAIRMVFRSQFKGGCILDSSRITFYTLEIDKKIYSHGDR